MTNPSVHLPFPSIRLDYWHLGFLGMFSKEIRQIVICVLERIVGFGAGFGIENRCLGSLVHN